MEFRRAIVRPPSANFADGLTTVDLGVPDFALARKQHAAYGEALEALGLVLTRLPEDPAHPDATFVEDAALVTAEGAILTRPGAESRAGEVASIETALRPFYPTLARIETPGTLDGGDVCEAGGHVFIGISKRTNPEGARQLAGWLGAAGRAVSVVDIRGLDTILHLKSGIAWLSGRRLVVIDALAADSAFAGWELVRVDPAEDYAANCVAVNGRLLFAEGFPKLERRLRDLGEHPVVLPMSEFRKMDGGLSCLSLRF